MKLNILCKKLHKK